MAHKRSARPPPPPPPVESSMETDSGSDSDESEIALSPPSASTKNIAPPPQKVQQPEASSDEDEEEDEEEEEEEEVEPNVTAPPPATTNPPPPPPSREESESEEEEEEETDDEAPEPEPVPKQAAEGNGVKPPPPPPPSSEDKKPAAPIQRSWSQEDEVRILETLAAHRREHGTLPKPEALEAALGGSLDNTDYSRKVLLGKVSSLKSVYTRNVKKSQLPTKDHERRIFDLSKEVWGGGGGGGDKPASGTVPSDFCETCKMYPYFGEVLKELEREQPWLLKRGLSSIDSETAHTMDQKIKKHRIAETKVHLHGLNLEREVTKTLLDLVQ